KLLPFHCAAYKRLRFRRRNACVAKPRLHPLEGEGVFSLLQAAELRAQIPSPSRGGLGWGWVDMAGERNPSPPNPRVAAGRRLPFVRRNACVAKPLPHPLEEGGVFFIYLERLTK